MIKYQAPVAYKAEKNSVIDTIKLQTIVDISKYQLKDAWINVGGWQSWNPGYEVAPGKKQDSLKCHFIKPWNQYLVFPETNFKSTRHLVLGQFVTYARWDDFYLVFVSCGNVNNTLPPVQFVFNRKENSVSIELCDKEKKWEKDELQAQIEVFTTDSYFQCKDKLKEIFNGKQFDKISALGDSPAGWESWYNHYSKIDEKLILEDLNSLKNTENIISKGNYSSLIFQIDDGWEEALGDWNIRTDRFPNGLKPIVQKIENENYIPGLWLAPFIIDSRSKTACEHPDWLLRNQKGQLVPAGYNPLWGKNGTFYCLDLSNEEVIEHLDSVINKVINEWGFRYLKLDFLYGGMLYGISKNPSASYETYSKTIKKLTSRSKTDDGKPVVYLGCGVPFESSFNYFPLSRIGCDTYEHWENKLPLLLNWNGRNSAYLNLKDTLGHALWNKTIFANDPDVLFIRNENCSLTQNEKELIAKVDILFGSQLMYSDDPSTSTSESEINLTNKILEFKNIYKNQEFSLKQIKKDYFKIKNKTGDIEGIIDLSKYHKITL